MSVDVPLITSELLVLDAETAKPMIGRFVTFRPERGGFTPSGSVNEEGRIQMTLPLGRYSIEDAGDGKDIVLPSGTGVQVDWTPQGPVPATVELTKAVPFEPVPR